ncbi:MAG: ABC transporter permease, partial [Candidatus Rokuibacteriota bacterium]
VESAVASFEASQGAVGELADLRIANGFAGIPEEILAEVREVDGVAAAGGLVTGALRGRLGDRPLDLPVVAVDLFDPDGVHRGLFSAEDIELRDPMDFVARFDAVALPRTLAEARGLGLGSHFEADLPTGRRSLLVAGLLDAPPESALSAGAVAVMDLPAAQRLFGRDRLLDAVHVRLAPGQDAGVVRSRLAARAEGRATVQEAGQENGELKSLLYNVHLVLNVAGAVALVVGALVIYHAVALSVSQRQSQIDALRAQGASRRSIAAVFSAEALAFGATGSVLGALGGAALAFLAAGLFEQAVEVLYSPLPRSSFRIAAGDLLPAVGLGITVTWLAALGPVLSSLRVTGGTLVA